MVVPFANGAALLRQRLAQHRDQTKQRGVSRSGYSFSVARRAVLTGAERPLQWRASARSGLRSSITR
ncbi:MAG: hypothetical protein LC721_05025, partial [Actinobacteria bacterium]|nr:hypothetical protein [Actinomycetota bacterium]